MTLARDSGRENIRLFLQFLLKHSSLQQFLLLFCSFYVAHELAFAWFYTATGFCGRRFVPPLNAVRRHF